MRFSVEMAIFECMKLHASFTFILVSRRKSLNHKVCITNAKPLPPPLYKNSTGSRDLEKLPLESHAWVRSSRPATGLGSLVPIAHKNLLSDLWLGANFVEPGPTLALRLCRRGTELI
jgi:hypothetical protein